MFDSSDSPALTSVLSIILAIVAVLFTAIYFAGVFQENSGLLIALAMIVAFAAVVSGMFSVASPSTGMFIAVVGIGIGIGVVVLGFLVFILNLAHS